MTARRYFGRTAALTVMPIRVARPVPMAAAVSWWTSAPYEHFSALCCAQILRMSFSKQAAHVTGMTVASASLKPAKQDVTPIGGYS